MCNLMTHQAVEEMTQQHKAVQLKYKKAAQRVLQGEQAMDKLGLEMQQLKNEVRRHEGGGYAKCRIPTLNPSMGGVVPIFVRDHSNPHTIFIFHTHSNGPPASSQGGHAGRGQGDL